MKSNAFEIIIDHERKIVRINLSGVLDEKRYRIVGEQGHAEGNKYGYHMLWDVRDTKLSLPIGTLYNMDMQASAKQDPKSRRLKAAALISPADREIWRFLENLNVNRGFTRKVFDSEDEALKWLTE